jgi:hypothetical protein
MLARMIAIRPVVQTDYPQWRPLWDGYNRFYGRFDATALPEEITAGTWARFFDGDEPVRALVAERDAKLVGLVHYIFHRSTTRCTTSATCRICSPMRAVAAKASAGR